MKKGSEGIRRIRIIISVIVSLTWLIFTFNWTEGFTYSRAVNDVFFWVFFLIIFLACFLVPWGIERIIYWIYKGFVTDIKKKKSQE